MLIDREQPFGTLEVRFSAGPDRRRYVGADTDRTEGHVDATRPNHNDIFSPVAGRGDSDAVVGGDPATP